MTASIAGEMHLEQKVKAAAWGIAFKCVESSRMSQEHFGKDPPPVRTMRFLKQKLLETGNLADDRQRSGRRKSADTDESRS